MTLTQIISLLDEDEHAWVVPPPESTMAPTYIVRPRASLLLWSRGHVIVTSSIGGVDIEMLTYGRAMQPRSVIGKNKRLAGALTVCHGSQDSLHDA
jgi:hypothetical protein